MVVVLLLTAYALANYPSTGEDVKEMRKFLGRNREDRRTAA